MAIIKDIEFGDGNVVSITDWGDYPIWSRIVYASEAATNQAQSFFQYLVGQAGPGITIASDMDTNMPSPGSLPAGHEMLVYSIQIIPDECVGADYVVGKETYNAGVLIPETTVVQAMYKWRTYFDNLLFQLRIEQSKTYVEGRMDHFPAGGGAHFEHTAATTEILPLEEKATPYAAMYQVTNGIQTWEAARRLATPIYLGSLETFRGILSRPRGVPGSGNVAEIDYDYQAGFTVRLTGPRKRPTM
jgi:hypothetical protein